MLVIAEQFEYIRSLSLWYQFYRWENEGLERVSCPVFHSLEAVITASDSTVHLCSSPDKALMLILHQPGRRVFSRVSCMLIGQISVPPKGTPRTVQKCDFMRRCCCPVVFQGQRGVRDWWCGAVLTSQLFELLPHQSSCQILEVSGEHVTDTDGGGHHLSLIQKWYIRTNQEK